MKTISPNSKKRRLLIVGSFPKRIIYGGIYNSCKLIVNSPYFSDFNIILFDSTQISNPAPSIIVRSFLAGVRLFRFIFKLLKTKPEATLIFCSDGASAFEKGVMIQICKSLDIKTLIFPRAGNLINQTNDSRIFRALIRNLFKGSDAFFAQGSRWKSYAIETLKISPNKISIVHNWTAKKEFLEIGQQKIYIKKQEIINFLFVGWLEKEKGVLEILKALKFLDDKKHKYTFTFVGDGKLMRSSRQFIKENNLTHKVFFVGWIKPSEIKNFYIKADVFVLPSWAEGMPNSLIEALSFGLASIVTDVGMICNYLQNNISALILPAKNLDLLQCAMEQLILDNKQREKLSKKGYLISKQYFSTDKGLEKMAKSIKKIF